MTKYFFVIASQRNYYYIFFKSEANYTVFLLKTNRSNHWLINWRKPLINLLFYCRSQHIPRIRRCGTTWRKIQTCLLPQTMPAWRESGVLTGDTHSLLNPLTTNTSAIISLVSAVAFWWKPWELKEAGNWYGFLTHLDLSK